MTPYRKFCWKTTVVLGALYVFTLLAQYSQWHASPEGQRYHMDKLHAKALSDHAQWKRQQIMSIWNITEADLSRPVDLFNEKGKL